MRAVVSRRMALEVLPVEAGDMETALINSLSFKDYPRAWVFPDRWLGTILYDSDLTQDSPEEMIQTS